ncbi:MULTISPECIES: hypothetical protein [unclassified Nocardioides]|uniref:hypothetical protein n=1 Tax=Nocardioides sp. URHA0032 TaxID=1380388 RepID=UPI00048F6351|nr:hypothetical protein [Nocardioides sp. URHA0032]
MYPLALAATAALIGLGTAAPTTQTTESTTTHERGIVVECSGTVQGRDVYASLYENNHFANVLQVLIGDDAQQVGGSRQDRDGFLGGGRVTAAMKVGGSRALISGTARKVGRNTPVHDEYDDAGQHITADGTHRLLDTDLDLTWRGRTVPLDCDTAFAYRLVVVRESTVD